MSAQKYTATGRILHWISAAVIIWATLSGFVLASLPDNSTLRPVLSSFNVSLTTAFVPVFLFRLAYVCRARRPARLPQPMRQQRLATAAHALLYALTTIVLASGIMMMDHAVDVFGLVQLPNPVTDPIWNRRFYLAHRTSCITLFLLILLHVAAVVRHHRAGRPILTRMV